MRVLHVRLCVCRKSTIGLFLIVWRSCLCVCIFLCVRVCARFEFLREHVLSVRMRVSRIGRRPPPIGVNSLLCIYCSVCCSVL